MRPTDERGRPIGASPGGLPAGEATPSRQSYADCGRGTPGGRLPRRPGSIYYRPTPTVHPTAAQTGILFSRSSRSLLQRFPLCTVVYLRLKVSFTGFSLGQLRGERLTVGPIACDLRTFCVPLTSEQFRKRSGRFF